MGIGKQAKILNAKQQTMVLSYLENTRYPLNNVFIELQSRFKSQGNIPTHMVDGM